jgi:predicted DsbA family dithiol-disulfide isomerase
VQALHFVAWSDYLCPWCYNAAVRLGRLEQEFGGEVRVEWRSYLLRPQPAPTRDLERFRRYTESWRRPGAEPDGGEFVPWQGEAGPPSHSVPPHQVAKAAASLGPEAFRSMHARLLRAYFVESQDITDTDTLWRLWRELALPEAAFERREDPQLLQQILEEHRQALEHGATGVPAVQLQGNDAVIVGAHPLDLYRRWVRRALEARAAGEAAP